ncbi:unnamed protein product, partial [Polarella glacialis]
LLLGGQGLAQSLPLLRQLSVTHIVNVTTSPNYFPGNFCYCQVPIEDDRSADLLQHLDLALTFMRSALAGEDSDCGSSKDNVVLVHCREGVSRSVSVVLAYLMRYNGIPAELGDSENTWTREITSTANCSDCLHL